MIPKSVPSVQAEPWQQALSSAFRDLGSLHAWLGLEAPDAMAGGSAAEFPLLVTRHFASLMERGNANDPLLRQILPLAAEQAPASGFGTDPLNEREFSEHGLVRKYAGRALWIMTGGCPVHCRYCFRRHFPYAEHALGPRRIDSALGRVARDPSISEVILSGGDPLIVADKHLKTICTRLSAIPHVRRLRIHTRVLTTLPQRVTPALIEALASFRGALVVVAHINHAQEIAPETLKACADLRSAGAQLLNQSVLLAGVNDATPVLKDLSEALIDAGIQPYYLHLLDRVAGAAHFEVDTPKAQKLMAELTAELSGYMLPTLVREEPGARAKTRIAPLED